MCRENTPLPIIAQGPLYRLSITFVASPLESPYKKTKFDRCMPPSPRCFDPRKDSLQDLVEGEVYDRALRRQSLLPIITHPYGKGSNCTASRSDNVRCQPTPCQPLIPASAAGLPSSTSNPSYYPSYPARRRYALHSSYPPPFIRYPDPSSQTLDRYSPEVEKRVGYDRSPIDSRAGSLCSLQRFTNRSHCRSCSSASVSDSCEGQRISSPVHPCPMSPSSAPRAMRPTPPRSLSGTSSSIEYPVGYPDLDNPILPRHTEFLNVPQSSERPQHEQRKHDQHKEVLSRLHDKIIHRIRSKKKDQNP